MGLFDGLGMLIEILTKTSGPPVPMDFPTIKTRSNPVTATNSFVDNVFRDDVTPSLGSVIHCDLSPIPGLSLLNLNAEHTGIYIGNNQIIHRSGNGYLEKVTPREFLDRLDGNNYAIFVYVSCKGTKPLKIDEAFSRAMKALHDPSHSGYNLLNKNCHNFTRYCLTGETDQWGMDFTFSSLKDLLYYKFGMDNWRVWKY